MIGFHCSFLTTMGKEDVGNDRQSELQRFTLMDAMKLSRAPAHNGIGTEAQRFPN